MEQIVKFVLVKNNIQIPSYEQYLEDVMGDVLKSVGVDILENGIVYVDASEKVDVEISDFYAEITVDEIQYFIGFSFATYGGTKQLEVDIYVESNPQEFYSSFIESVQKSSKVHFSEKFKIKLKSGLLYRNCEKVKIWDRCIWLKDKQAQYFSSQLYPLIYETENLFREFISSILTKVYGGNWWEEIIPIDIKEEQIARQGGYKAIVSTLNDVEDYLMSIDVSTLKKIVSLKISKWNICYDKTVEQIIQLFKKNKNTKTLDEKLIKRMFDILSTQLEEKDNLWDEFFSKYLPNEFFKEFEEFSKNRNHVAHNKVLDRNAYLVIKLATEKIREYLEKAICKANQEIKSIERKNIERLEQEYDEMEYQETLQEIIESETGVRINNRDSIFQIFEESIQKLFSEVCDRLRFRMDIEIDDDCVYEPKEGEQYLFSVKHKILDKTVQVKCDSCVDDSEGAMSTLTMLYSNQEIYNKHEIIYTNGEASFDYEQGCYIPETQDEFGEEDLRNTINEIVDYINQSLVSIKAQVDGGAYKIIKDGGRMPIIDEPCWNCGENYICIDESIAEYGQCLCCGELNDIYECEKCGYMATEYFEFAGVQLCEHCYEKIKHE
jgi:hypothetical protein